MKKLLNHKVTILLFSVLLILAAVSGCGKEDVPPADADQTKPASAGQSEAAPLSVGQTGKTETLAVSVTGVKKATEWINGPAEGREYVVVSLEITNISKEEQSVSANDFQFVSDASGSRESYAASTGVEAEPPVFGGEDIAPGDTFQGSLVFAIPKDMSSVELDYIQSLGAKPDLRFQFGK